MEVGKYFTALFVIWRLWSGTHGMFIKLMRINEKCKNKRISSSLKMSVLNYGYGVMLDRLTDLFV